MKAFLAIVAVTTLALSLSHVAAGLEYGATFLIFAALATLGAVITLGVRQ